MVAFTLLALRLAELRGTLPAVADRASCARSIDALPELAAAYLADDAPVWAQTEEIARAVVEKEFFLYIGRHLGVPVCLEGALKLKEISYIPTDCLRRRRDEARARSPCSPRTRPSSP